MSPSTTTPPADPDLLPAYPLTSPSHPYITTTHPFDQALSHHLFSPSSPLASTPGSPFYHRSRVYIIASASLARDTDCVQRLRAELGDKVVGVREGMRPHTYWSEILEVVAEVRRTEADVLVTVGAGSLTDGGKIVALAHANHASTFADLDKLHSGSDWSRPRPDLTPPAIPLVCVPTSLSGGEYSFLGGGTHDATQAKFGFGHPTRGPVLVVLDAQLTTTTPAPVWLQSGVRAVDHCVEGLCSLDAKRSATSDEFAARGLQSLIPGLLQTRRTPQDLAARAQCQRAVIDAMAVVFQCGVPMGASHALGHQLGPLGVGHGATSCVLLPAVCKYNLPANRARQDVARALFWEDAEAAQVFARRGLRRETADLGDLLDAFLRELDMPRSLRDVGIEGDDVLGVLEVNALQDHWCATNPRPLHTREHVRAILDMVKG